MLKFSDIESKTDPELQSKLHRAQDAVSEKQAQVDDLREIIEKAKSALEADRASLAEAEKALATAHQGHGRDADALEKAMTAARKAKSTAASKIQGGEEKIKDIEQGLKYAIRELEELENLRDKARLHVLRGLKVATQFPMRPSEKVSLTELDSIQVDDMIMAYFLISELTGTVKNPFAGDVGYCKRLFSFIAQYFAAPSQEDVAIMRNRFDAMIWGDYDVPLKGGRGRVKGSAASPVNMDFVGGMA